MCVFFLISARLRLSALYSLLPILPSSVVVHHSHVPLRSLSHTLQRFSKNVLDIGHRCSWSTSPCGSIASICSLLLSISAHLTCMLLVLSLNSHMKTLTSSLVKSGLLHPTFSSSSFISCAFALAQPFDDKQSSLHHRTSFWFCTFVFSLVALAFLSRPSAHRQLRPRQLRYRLKTVDCHLVPLTLPSPFVSQPFLSCALARAEPRPRLFKNYHRTHLLGHFNPGYRHFSPWNFIDNCATRTRRQSPKWPPRSFSPLSCPSILPGSSFVTLPLITANREGLLFLVLFPSTTLPHCSYSAPSWAQDPPSPHYVRTEASSTTVYALAHAPCAHLGTL